MKKRATAPRHDRAASAAETPSAPMPEPKPRAKMRAPKAEGTGLVSRLKAYRPTPKHIFFAAVVLLLVLRPWLVFGLLFLSAFILTGIFLILGYDGFWRRIMSVARWYARRHPSRSAEVHRKLDGFAMRFDAFLDRFPEGSVDGLYLPDFGDLAQEEARHDEALDRRFDSLRQSEA